MEWRINLHFQHQVEVLLLKLFYWREIGDSGIVHQDIHWAKDSLRFLDQLLSMLCQGQVATNRMSLTTRRPNTPDH